MAGALMAGLSLVLYWVLVYAYASQRKQDSAVEGDRACAIAVTRVERLLLGGRVLTPGVGGTAERLEFEYAARDEESGYFLLEGGVPEWRGPVALELQLQPDTGEQLLTQVESSQPDRVLARLGPSGQVRFTRLTDRLLEVSVVAESLRQGDATRSYRSQSLVRLYLQNQG